MTFSPKHFFYYTLFFVALILFSYFFLDKTIAHYFLSHVDSYEVIGDFLSKFGESHWYIGVGILGFTYFNYYKKDELLKQQFLFLLYINIFSGLISLVSKFIFGRIRPWGFRDNGDEFGFLLFQNFDIGVIEKFKYQFITLVDSPTTYTSFPSGHSTTIFAIFTYIIILFPKYMYLWLGISVILASARLLDNDHFLSDILAGVLVGTLSTLFIYSKMRKKLEKVI